MCTRDLTPRVGLVFELYFQGKAVGSPMSSAQGADEPCIRKTLPLVVGGTGTPTGVVQRGLGEASTSQYLNKKLVERYLDFPLYFEHLHFYIHYYLALVLLDEFSLV